mmetsp:Transcript_5099/g.13952  ORF Transcript_5099/g.13952 Transcript_5099/m.13952 type:complete len:306 (+) Transcript_5099:1590-2507(+)
MNSSRNISTTDAFSFETSMTSRLSATKAEDDTALSGCSSSMSQTTSSIGKSSTSSSSMVRCAICGYRCRRSTRVGRKPCSELRAVSVDSSSKSLEKVVSFTSLTVLRGPLVPPWKYARLSRTRKPGMVESRAILMSDGSDRRRLQRLLSNGGGERVHGLPGGRSTVSSLNSWMFANTPSLPMHLGIACRASSSALSSAVSTLSTLAAGKSNDCRSGWRLSTDLPYRPHTITTLSLLRAYRRTSGAVAFRDCRDSWRVEKTLLGSKMSGVSSCEQSMMATPPDRMTVPPHSSISRISRSGRGFATA